MINSGKFLFDSPDLNAIFEDSTKKVTASIAGGKTRTLYLGNDNKNIIHPYYEIEVRIMKKVFQIILQSRKLPNCLLLIIQNLRCLNK